MQKHLSDSTATYPGGISPNHRLLMVPNGSYAGRVALLFQSASSLIKLSYADYPYSTWSSPVTVINDTGDYPFDALIDEIGITALINQITTMLSNRGI